MTALPHTRQAIGESLDTTGRHTRRMARAGRRAASDIGGEARTLLAELEETLADGTQADAQVLRAQLRRNIEAARERLGDTRDAVRRRARDAWSDADDYVRERPWQALAAAAGIAVLVGVIVGRR